MGEDKGEGVFLVPLILAFSRKGRRNNSKIKLDQFTLIVPLNNPHRLHGLPIAPVNAIVEIADHLHGDAAAVF